MSILTRRQTLVALGRCAASAAVSLPPWMRPQDVLSPRGLWVWDEAPVLHDPQQQRTFLDFCQRHRVTFEWMQIATSRTGVGRRLESGDDWKTLLAEGHRRGMRLAALDGDPHYALPEQHDLVLAIVDAVVAYNAAAQPAERFDGIHFDIEPYALEAWKDAPTRAQLLTAYLDLTARAAARAHAGGARYATDVPYWWTSRDPTTGEAMTAITFRGVRQAATDHLLEMVDAVGIMDYRTQATGPEGLIQSVLGTLRRADQLKKARVFVGVETEDVGTGVPASITFAGKSMGHLNAELATAERAFIGYRSFAGIAIHQYRSFQKMAGDPK